MIKVCACNGSPWLDLSVDVNTSFLHLGLSADADGCGCRSVDGDTEWKTVAGGYGQRGVREEHALAQVQALGVGHLDNPLGELAEGSGCVTANLDAGDLVAKEPQVSGCLGVTAILLFDCKLRK